jgi:hypothetical protein
MTGESITEAVKTALRDRLEHEQRRRGKKLDRARIDTRSWPASPLCL